jgi:SH3-like domain-containing protein
VISIPVKSLGSHPNRILLLAILLILALTVGCKRQAFVHHEYRYVSAAETSLRDRVAMIYNKVGTVRNGDRVEVLEKQRRFLRVRTDTGQEGWIEERSLAPQEVYDDCQKLAQDNANDPVQGHATTRAELNMHIEPSREAEHLYQLSDGEKVEVLKRATAPKNPPPAIKAAEPGQSKSLASAEKTAASHSAKSESEAHPASHVEPTQTSAEQPALPPPIMEDWSLVRTSSGHVGWVLMRMIDLDIPLDVAQYSEGQRIIAYFVLNNVDEDGKQIPQYLVALNQTKDGLPWDFNQIRVFTRNRAKHRYETAYRERNIEGYMPITTGHQDFGKDGDLPTFTIRQKNDQGQLAAVTYKLNGPIVSRVLTPEEEAVEKAKHQAALAARMKEIEARRAAHPNHRHKRH